MKKGLIIFSIFLGLFIFTKPVWAYDLTLTSVGPLSTLGTSYSLVNYTGGVPTLTGTASPSASVGININTVLSYTTASVSGVWQYVPSALNQGDNTIVLSSGTQSITFTLRFNATTSGTTTATPAAIPDEASLPKTGVWEYYLPAIAAGLGVLCVGRYGRKWMQKWEKGD
jgi:hypothetical protein